MGPIQMSFDNMTSARELIQRAIDSSSGSGADNSLMALLFGIILFFVMGMVVSDMRRSDQLTGTAKPDSYYVKIQNRIFIIGALYTLTTAFTLAYFLSFDSGSLSPEQQPAVELAKSIVAQAEKTSSDAIEANTPEQAKAVLQKATMLLTSTQDALTPAMFEESLQQEGIATSAQTLGLLEKKLEMAVSKRAEMALYANIIGAALFLSILAFLSYSIRNKKFGLNENQWVDGIRLAALFVVVIGIGSLTPIGPEQDRAYLQTVLTEQEARTFEVAVKFAQKEFPNVELSEISASHVYPVVADIRVKFATENLLAIDTNVGKPSSSGAAQGLVSVVNEWKEKQS